MDPRPRFNNLPPDAFRPAHVPDFTWAGGAAGDDVDQATATVKVDERGIGDYMPRTQADRATQLGTTLAVDVTRARGWIAPYQPYGPPPAAPVITSLTPNTAQVGDSPVLVTITGTGFSNWSWITTGGYRTEVFRFVSPTEIVVVMDPTRAAPGETDVIVTDHNVRSNAVPFTFAEEDPEP